MLVDFMMIVGICVVTPIVMIGGLLIVEHVIDKILSRFGK